MDCWKGSKTQYTVAVLADCRLEVQIPILPQTLECSHPTSSSGSRAVITDLDCICALHRFPLVRGIQAGVGFLAMAVPHHCRPKLVWTSYEVLTRESVRIIPWDSSRILANDGRCRDDTCRLKDRSVW